MDKGVSQKFYYLDYFVNYAREAQHYEDSTLFAWLGRKRSGKSMTCLAACKRIDPDFDEDKIVFDIKDFNALVKDSETNQCSVMWDEASVTAYTRDYMQEANKTLNKLMQVYGFKKVAINCTFLHLNFLDKHTREVLDLIFRCYYRRKKVDGNRIQNVYVEPYTVITDWIRDPYLEKYKISQDGVFTPVGAVPVPQLDDLYKWGNVNNKLLKAYQKKKIEFFETVGDQDKAEDERKKRVTKKDLLVPVVERLIEPQHGYTIKDACEVAGLTEQYYHRLAAKS